MFTDQIMKYHCPFHLDQSFHAWLPLCTRHPSSRNGKTAQRTHLRSWMHGKMEEKYEHVHYFLFQCHSFNRLTVHARQPWHRLFSSKNFQSNEEWSRRLWELWGTWSVGLLRLMHQPFCVFMHLLATVMNISKSCLFWLHMVHAQSLPWTCQAMEFPKTRLTRVPSTTLPMPFCKSLLHSVSNNSLRSVISWETFQPFPWRHDTLIKSKRAFWRTYTFGLLPKQNQQRTPLPHNPPRRRPPAWPTQPQRPP